MSTNKEAVELTFNIKFNGHEIKDINMDDVAALYQALDNIVAGNKNQYAPNTEFVSPPHPDNPQDSPNGPTYRGYKVPWYSPPANPNIYNPHHIMPFYPWYLGNRYIVTSELKNKK